MAFAYQVPQDLNIASLPINAFAPAMLAGARMIQQPLSEAEAIKRSQLENALMEAMNPLKIAEAKSRMAMLPQEQALRSQQISDALLQIPAKQAQEGIFTSPQIPGRPATLPALPTGVPNLEAGIEEASKQAPPEQEAFQQAVDVAYPPPRITQVAPGAVSAPALGGAAEKEALKHRQKIEEIKAHPALSISDKIALLNKQYELKGGEAEKQRTFVAQENEKKAEALKERVQMEIDAKTNLAKVKASENLGPTQAKMARSETDSLRQDPRIKEFWVVGREFSIMEEALKTSEQTGNFAGVDQAIINQLNKMENPGSVVRQQAYKVTQSETSLFNSLLGKWQQIQRGGEANISDAERRNFLNLGKKYEQVATDKAAEAIIAPYSRMSKVGIAPDNYLSPDLISLLPKTPSIPLAKGEGLTAGAPPAAAAPAGPPAKIPAGAKPLRLKDGTIIYYTKD